MGKKDYLVQLYQQAVDAKAIGEMATYKSIQAQISLATCGRKAESNKGNVKTLTAKTKKR